MTRSAWGLGSENPHAALQAFVGLASLCGLAAGCGDALTPDPMTSSAGSSATETSASGSGASSEPSSLAGATASGGGSGGTGGTGGTPAVIGGADGGLVEPSACDEGQTRVAACGLNDRGSRTQRCTSDGWTNEGDCDDPDECEDGDRNVLSTLCGRNDRGDVVQDCEGGQWSEGQCDDPDECTDDDERTSEDACGLNGRGSLEETCESGEWSGGACDDPDECTDDDEVVTTDVCGFNDRGDLVVTCEDGEWGAGVCDDPDECTDGVVEPVACWQGAGEADRECVDGAWQVGDCTLTAIVRVSVSSGGSQGNQDSTFATANGGLVAFQSRSDNFAEDAAAVSNAFLHDLGTRATDVLRAENGDPPALGSASATLSASGRFVAFSSRSAELVNEDTNDATDIFVWDRQLGAIDRVSVASGGTQSNGNSSDPSISADGRYVAFASEATNLVAADGNALADVFVHDRSAGTTVLVSRASSGGVATGMSGAPAVSDDGRYVAFHSNAPDVVGADGNAEWDVFLRDVQAGTTTRVSVTHESAESNEASYTRGISADGRYVAFLSYATNLVAGDDNAVDDIFVRDVTGNTTIRVSVGNGGVQGNGRSSNATMSADGRYVAFQSLASNFAANDTNDASDIFVRDIVGATTYAISVATGGGMGNDLSERPRITADGRHVAFESLASDLVGGDTNDRIDVFLAPVR